MKRPTLNRLTDALAFAGFVFVVATGFLLRALLPPGSGSLQGVGTGYGAAQRPIMLLWGLSRHDWGTLHFWIALGLMIVLAFHLVLHWRWIVRSIRGRAREGSGVRVGLGIVGVLTLVAIALTPWVSPTTRVPRAHLREPVAADRPLTPQDQTTPPMRGMMTFQEIEDLTGVPTTYIIQNLSLPQGVSPDERLGRLRRAHGFTMQDVRRIVVEYYRK